MTSARVFVSGLSSSGDRVRCALARGALLSIGIIALVGTGSGMGAFVNVPTAGAAVNAGAASPPGEDGATGTLGYYRFPALHGETIVFVAEGDLWQVGADGGLARRLTTHPEEETRPAISPDGATLAFSASYEGPEEVYTMPVDGGRPVRQTWQGDRARVVGWTPDGRVLYSSRHYATLPARQLLIVHPRDGAEERVPLFEAADGVFAPDGRLYFTRYGFHGSYTKRYRGGAAQDIWTFAEGDEEARRLTVDHEGTDAAPLWWNGRVYFVSDRDGTRNLWSMTPMGKDVRRHTEHVGWDVKSPDLSHGRIVYQLGADLHRYDIDTDRDHRLDIELASDFDQTRERWIEEPMDWVSTVDVSADGDHVVLTARGRVTVLPTGKAPERIVELTPEDGVRARGATFLGDGENVVYFSDASGEVELWSDQADGFGEPVRHTEDGHILRVAAHPSPDGRYVAHADKDFILWLSDLETGEQREIVRSEWGWVGDVAWSDDSGWIAYTIPAENDHSQVHLYSLSDSTRIVATTDRNHCWSPAFSPDGAWLWFLSDRAYEGVRGNVWALRQGEPRLENPTRIMAVALDAGARWPFRPENELEREEAADEEEGPETPDSDDESVESPAEGETGNEDRDEADDAAVEEDEPADEEPAFEIDADGLARRLFQLDVPAGRYGSLSATADRLIWLTGTDEGVNLTALAISDEAPEPIVIATSIRNFGLSSTREKLLVIKRRSLHVLDASAGAGADLEASRVNLGGWRLRLDPREEWRQMFVEAWRLERDYFYDRNMHGVDWPAMLEKYRPLSLRVTSRAELSDLLGELMGELSALHTYVYGGDFRDDEQDIRPLALGGTYERDEAAGGWRITQIYPQDPELPEALAPLASPEVAASVGEVITRVNGRPALDAPAMGELLRLPANRPIRIELRAADGDSTREVMVTPISTWSERRLRYASWEYTRRLRVDERGDGRVGYVHLRDMGTGSFAQWMRDFYPVHRRPGLIVDVRRNNGGNIDSWILSRLMRQSWMFWSNRSGSTSPNMQYAFDGHVVVIMDPFTISDGEAFAEGFRRLGLGKLVGTRTLGAEIWLTSSNRLVDHGIATAAEFGVFGPEGEWIIEGHGVEPDIEVDTLPHAAFKGEDRMLDAAVDHLLELIEEDPRERPGTPPYPDKSVEFNRKR